MKLTKQRVSDGLGKLPKANIVYVGNKAHEDIKNWELTKIDGVSEEDLEEYLGELGRIWNADIKCLPFLGKDEAYMVSEASGEWVEL